MSRELHHHVWDTAVSVGRVRVEELARADAQRRADVETALRRESAIQRTVESLEYLLAIASTRPDLVRIGLWERAADLVDATEGILHPKG